MWTLISNDSCPYTKDNLDTETDVHTGRMMIKHTGRRWLSTCQEEQPRTDCSLKFLQRNQPGWHIDFGHPGSRTGRQWISVIIQATQFVIAALANKYGPLARGSASQSLDTSPSPSLPGSPGVPAWASLRWTSGCGLSAFGTAASEFYCYLLLCLHQAGTLPIAKCFWLAVFSDL